MTTPWQPGFQGVTVVPPGYNDPHNWSPAPALQLVAATPAAGVALVNGTPNILTWTAPADNQMHMVMVVASVHITSLETGGVLAVNSTIPDGTSNNAANFITGGNGVGVQSNAIFRVVQAGSTVTLAQGSALTGGAATAVAQLWAS